MGEFHCWIDQKDNLNMTPAEIAEYQKKICDPLNAETLNLINDQWNHEQGPLGSWQKPSSSV